MKHCLHMPIIGLYRLRTLIKMIFSELIIMIKFYRKNSMNLRNYIRNSKTWISIKLRYLLLMEIIQICQKV